MQFIPITFMYPVLWCAQWWEAAEKSVIATDFSTFTCMILLWYCLYIVVILPRDQRLWACDIFLRWTKERAYNYPLNPQDMFRECFSCLGFVPPLLDSSSHWRGSHPWREGHRSTEAFPWPLGSLFQATSGEGGETVWSKVLGKSSLVTFLF